MLNFAQIIGRLVKDPVLRKTGSDKSVVNITVAVDRDYKKDGSQNADFINCLAWDKTADNINSFAKKGSLICVCGRNQSRTQEDKDGNKKFYQEILIEKVYFLGNKNSENNKKKEENSEATSYQDTSEINSDDLPF